MTKSPMKEAFLFLKENKLWWMIPIGIVLLTAALLIYFGQPSAERPFVYSIF